MRPSGAAPGHGACPPRICGPLSGIPCLPGFGVMDDLNAATADRYRTFADWARDASPLYEEFAHGVADDPRVLAFVSTLPVPKRQPNLLFAAVKYLTGVLPHYSSFRSFVNSRESALRKLMLERSTQTNEPGRCAVMLPLLSTLRQPIALLEVGASAGLCLVPDRYGSDYGGHRVGAPDAPVVLSCEPTGPVPLPGTVPQIVWRRGIDLNPLDPADPDTAGVAQRPRLGRRDGPGRASPRRPGRGGIRSFESDSGRCSRRPRPAGAHRARPCDPRGLPLRGVAVSARGGPSPSRGDDLGP